MATAVHRKGGGWSASDEYMRLEKRQKELATKQRILVKQQRLREESRMKFGQIHYKRLLREKVNLNRHLQEAQERNRDILANIENLERESALAGRELSAPPDADAAGTTGELYASEAARKLEAAKRSYARAVAARGDAWRAESAERARLKAAQLERLAAREEELARRRAAFQEAFSEEQRVARAVEQRRQAVLLQEAAERSDHAAREEFRATLARQRAEFDAAVRRAGGPAESDHYYDHTAGGALPLPDPFFYGSSPTSRQRGHHGGLGAPSATAARPSVTFQDHATGRQAQQPPPPPQQQQQSGRPPAATGLVQVSSSQHQHQHLTVDASAAAKQPQPQPAVRVVQVGKPASLDARQVSREAAAKSKADLGSKSTADDEESSPEGESSTEIASAFGSTYTSTGLASAESPSPLPSPAPSPPLPGRGGALAGGEDNDTLGTETLSGSDSAGSSNSHLLAAAGGGRQPQQQRQQGKQQQQRTAALETLQLDRSDASATAAAAAAAAGGTGRTGRGLESSESTGDSSNSTASSIAFPLDERQSRDAFDLLARRIQVLAAAAANAPPAGGGSQQRGGIAATYALLSDAGHHRVGAGGGGASEGAEERCIAAALEGELEMVRVRGGSGAFGAYDCCAAALRIVRDCGPALVPDHLWSEAEQQQQQQQRGGGAGVFVGSELTLRAVDDHHADEFSGTNESASQLWRALVEHLRHMAGVSAPATPSSLSSSDNDVVVDSMCVVFAGALVGQRKERLPMAMTLIRSICGGDDSDEYDDYDDDEEEGPAAERGFGGSTALQRTNNNGSTLHVQDMSTAFLSPTMVGGQGRSMLLGGLDANSDSDSDDDQRGYFGAGGAGGGILSSSSAAAAAGRQAAPSAKTNYLLGGGGGGGSMGGGFGIGGMPLGGMGDIGGGGRHGTGGAFGGDSGGGVIGGRIGYRGKK